MVSLVLVFITCFRFDECVEGGESILLDTYPVVEEMRRKYPKQFDTLTRVPATFETIPSDRSVTCIPISLTCAQP